MSGMTSKMKRKSAHARHEKAITQLLQIVKQLDQRLLALEGGEEGTIEHVDGHVIDTGERCDDTKSQKR